MRHDRFDPTKFYTLSGENLERIWEIAKGLQLKGNPSELTTLGKELKDALKKTWVY